jgi:toxin ParE1/3/4
MMLAVQSTRSPIMGSRSGCGGSGLMVQRAAARLGEKFVREVGQAIVRILRNPLAFPAILRRHEVRRVLTKRFPYRIFFSLKDDAVVVHVVLHGHRDDRHWKDRL